MDVFEEMRIGLLLQRAMLGEERFMIARQFVKMATLDAARALGMDDEIGSLEPGKQADIIAVDLSKSHQIPTHHPYSTLVHTANQENVLWTMVGGRGHLRDPRVEPARPRAHLRPRRGDAHEAARLACAAVLQPSKLLVRAGESWRAACLRSVKTSIVRAQARAILRDV